MTGKCPICGKERKREFFPFCSPKCKNIDLLNWADGRYQISGSEAMSEDDNSVRDNSDDTE